MKQKTIALLLCLLLLLAGCGKEEEAGIVGSWEAAVDASVLDDSVQSGTSPEVSMVLQLHQDGSGACQLTDGLHPDNTLSFRYQEAEGTLSLVLDSGSELTLVVQQAGDSLTLSHGTTQVVFTRKT